MKNKNSRKFQELKSNLIIFSFIVKILFSSQLQANQGLNLNYPTNYIMYQTSILNQQDLKIYLEDKLVLHYIDLYTKCRELPKLVQRSKYKIEHILTELKKQELPKELVLLPIIESSYNSAAVSHKGATGIWQISRIAAKKYGLIEISPIDQKITDFRSDIVASTNAALAYLQFLHRKFNQNWLFALAAYNAGETRISKAIAHHKFNGKNANYWELTMPRETRHYLPKFLALAIIFNNPAEYGLTF